MQVLFSPFTVKNVTIPNRTVVPAMVSNYCGKDGHATERYIAYHEAKAKGGWGLIITEDYAVAPEGKGYPMVAGLWKDDQIAGHSELPGRVHRHGAKILAQIYHAGRQTCRTIIGAKPVAPSAVICPRGTEVPRPLTIPEIETIIEQFGDTALRAQKAGFDGVEIHGGHGYLLAQFMSPYSNKRLDEYGGNFENRMRFPLAVIRNIRRKCGGGFIIGYRISADEHTPGGRTIEDTKAVVPLLEETGIDMVHVSVGAYGNDGIVPPSYVRHGWIVDHAAEIKKLVSIPVITVGRINDPRIAEQILRSGKADLVAMGRASLADPEMPNKARAGRFGEIRYCFGCKIGCSGELNGGRHIRCALNPELGRECDPPLPKTAAPKRVAVVGAGPAGLEAAIRAAARGHDVTVYEKGDQPGGQFRLASVPPHKGEIVEFINWQLSRLKKLGVPVVYNTTVTPEFLKNHPADAVIAATGSRPVIPAIKGLDTANCVTAHDVLDGKVFPGSTVVVIGGGLIGAETANYMVALGRAVTVVEMLPVIVSEEISVLRERILDSLESGRASILTNATVTEVAKGSVTVKNNRTGDVMTIPADTIVLAVGVLPDTALAEALAAEGAAVTVIGDAAGGNNVLKATDQAYTVAASL